MGGYFGAGLGAAVKGYEDAQIARQREEAARRQEEEFGWRREEMLKQRGLENRLAEIAKEQVPYA